jgi:hypothetical protein
MYDRSENSRVETEQEVFAPSECAAGRSFAGLYAGTAEGTNERLKPLAERLAPGEFFARLGLGNPYATGPKPRARKLARLLSFLYPAALFTFLFLLAV